MLRPPFAGALRALLVAAALTAASACRDQPPDAKTTAAGPEAVPAAPLAVPAAQPAVPAAPAPAAAVRPGAPVGLSARATSPSEVALTWKAPPGQAGVARYEVYRDRDLVATTGETTAVHSGLRPWTRHCYTVRAVDAEGLSSEPTRPACARTLDLEPPTQPQALVAAAAPGDGVSLSWKPSGDDVGVEGYEVFRGSDRVGLVEASQFTEQGLVPLVEHCYTVRALDRAGNRSELAGPACATVPDTTPPSVPGDVGARAIGETAVHVAWSASTDDVGVVNYQLSRPGWSGPRTVSGIAFTDEGLSALTRYCYSVRACDAAGNCSPESPGTCATTPDLTPPSRPPGCLAKATSDTEVAIEWGASTDNVAVASYEVLRGSKRVAQVASPQVVREGGLRPTVEYCYVVRAFDSWGNRSQPSAPACATTPDLTPPTVPGGPLAQAMSWNRIAIGWEPSTDDVGVAGYEVLREGRVVATTTTATRVREAKLVAQHEHCYQVRAFDAAGNRSGPSAPACATTLAITDIAPPSELRASRLSATRALLEWEGSESPDALYRVYTEGKSTGVTGSTRYVASGSLVSRPHCFRVTAVVGLRRESPQSNEACIAEAPPAREPGAQ